MANEPLNVFSRCVSSQKNTDGKLKNYEIGVNRLDNKNCLENYASFYENDQKTKLFFISNVIFGM